MSKRKKMGFTIVLYSKGSEENRYHVHFEQKGKVVFCHLHDTFLECTFRGKSVCHEDDTFKLEIGMQHAYDEVIVKRFKAFDKLSDKMNKKLFEIEDHETNINAKFSKFISDRLKDDKVVVKEEVEINVTGMSQA